MSNHNTFSPSASIPAPTPHGKSRLLACLIFALLFIAALSSATAQNVTFAGVLTTVPAQGLHCPRGIAVDPSGNVFIADSNDSRIVEVPSGGGAEFNVGTGLNGPNGITVTPGGVVFIGDSRNNRALEIPAGGTAQFTVGAGLNYPGGIAVDNAGDIFIADTSNSRVVEVPSDGGSQFTVGTGFRYPLDVALDSTGNLFVADTKKNNVIEIPANGGPQITLPFTGLTNPSGVVTDASGDVFVTDSSNGRVLELPFGSTTPITVCSSSYGICSALIYPYGLAMDGAGDLFIVDHAGAVGDCPAGGSGSRAIELQLQTVNFGTVVAPSSQTLTLNYNISQSTTVGNISISPQNGFVLANSTCLGSISPGSCLATVTFSPQGEGVQSAQISLTDSGGNVLATTSLQGTGVDATTTKLTSSVDPATPGEPVTFTATVSSNDGPIPDGEVVRLLNGAIVLATGTLAGGSTSFTVSTLRTGTTLVTASYEGDATFSGSTSTAVRQVVKQPPQ